MIPPVMTLQHAIAVERAACADAQRKSQTFCCRCLCVPWSTSIEKANQTGREAW